MTWFIGLIGGITFVILAALGLAEYRRPKNRKDQVEPKLHRSKKKAVLTRTTSQQELLAVLADKDCDYYTMVSALKLLGLANGNSQMVFPRGAGEKFDVNRLMEIADRFWAWRWPNLSRAKCGEEISLAAKGLINNFGLDPKKLEELIAAIRQKCQTDIAEAMEAEILAQAEERRQKLAEEILPFPVKKQA